MPSPDTLIIAGSEEFSQNIENADVFIPLKLNDRCDKCNAQAFVSTHPIIAGPLLFCGHHFAKYEAKLVAGGWVIQDERHKINAKPSPSANAD